ncbi:MAG: twin-arginine translocation signal domain-containing protein [Deltaproteobacteria bacterium]|nr:twin-arginine translocation signal domain-containing protein [Candidatus Tharpella aukensis]
MKDEKKLHRRGFIKRAAIISGVAICGAVSAKKAKAAGLLL